MHRTNISACIIGLLLALSANSMAKVQWPPPKTRVCFPPGACWWACVDATVKIDGKVRYGIPVKVTGNLLEAARQGINYAALGDIDVDHTHDLLLKTDRKGKIRGCFRYRMPGAPWIKPLGLMFTYRTAFNGDLKFYGPTDTSYDFKRTINFDGPGSKDFWTAFREHQVKLRLPLEPRGNFYPVWPRREWFFGGVLDGPFGFDHVPPWHGKDHSKQWGRWWCTNYQQRDYFTPLTLQPRAYCYGGHDGTDYMLRGGFAQMARKKTNWVVAAADGRVLEVKDSLTDDCHSPLLYGKRHVWPIPRDWSFSPKCPKKDKKGKTVTDKDGNIVYEKQVNGGNHVILVHGKKGDMKTVYWHIKKGSALVKVGENVSCGQKLAEIGSSGTSTAPHLHFSVERKTTGGAWRKVDPYHGKLSHHEKVGERNFSYWVEQDSISGLPKSKCQPLKSFYLRRKFMPALAVKVDDLGIKSKYKAPGRSSKFKKPPDLARWFKITTTVTNSKDPSRLYRTRVTSYKYPKTAFHKSYNSGELNRVFFVPIAPVKDPALSEHEFDVVVGLKDVASSKPALLRKDVRLPRSSLTMAVGMSKPARLSGHCTLKPRAVTGHTGLSGIRVNRFAPTGMARIPTATFGAVGGKAERYHITLSARASGFSAKDQPTIVWTARRAGIPTKGTAFAKGSRAAFVLCPGDGDVVIQARAHNKLEEGLAHTTVRAPYLEVKVSSLLFNALGQSVSSIKGSRIFGTTKPTRDEAFPRLRLSARSIMHNPSKLSGMNPVTRPKYEWSLAWAPTNVAGHRTPIPANCITYSRPYNGLATITFTRPCLKGGVMTLKGPGKPAAMNVWASIRVKDAHGRDGAGRHQAANYIAGSDGLLVGSPRLKPKLRAISPWIRRTLEMGKLGFKPKAPVQPPGLPTTLRGAATGFSRPVLTIRDKAGRFMVNQAVPVDRLFKIYHQALRKKVHQPVQSPHRR